MHSQAVISSPEQHTRGHIVYAIPCLNVFGTVVRHESGTHRGTNIQEQLVAKHPVGCAFLQYFYPDTNANNENSY